MRICNRGVYSNCLPYFFLTTLVRSNGRAKTARSVAACPGPKKLSRTVADHVYVQTWLVCHTLCNVTIAWPQANVCVFGHHSFVFVCLFVCLFGFVTPRAREQSLNWTKHKQIMKVRNTQKSKLQPKNRQDTACRIEFADLGFNFQRAIFCVRNRSCHWRKCRDMTISLVCRDCVLKRSHFCDPYFLFFLSLVWKTQGGYRDSASLLGESWWQTKWGAIRGKKLHKNREIVVEWMVGVVGA